MTHYLKDHWLGHHSLKRSLLLNALAPVCVLLLVQHYVMEPLVQNRVGLRLPLLVTMALLYTAVLTIAAVSINRKSRIESTLIYGAGNHVMACNTFLFIAACSALVNVIDINTRGIETQTTIKDAFSAISLSADPSTPGRHYLSGEITPSSPRLLRTYLVKNPGVHTLILDSTGGHIYSARAMANAILTRGISTHVEKKCYSACTLVFISGTERSAGASASFGFHGYAYRLADAALYGAVDEQQKKDADLFLSQGVQKRFVDTMFDEKPPDLWQPPLSELKNAFVLHHIQ